MVHERDVTIDRAEGPLLSSVSSNKEMFAFLTNCSVMSMIKWMQAALLVTVVLALVACSATTGTGRPVGPVTYGQTAKVNYDRGMVELERKSLDRARRYFKHVRREFPYSRFATLSDLRLADCDFSEENFAEAAAAYRRFVRLHRTHEKADHAAFRRGLSFHKMIPTDWFLVPPSYERDMSATRDALRELTSFLRRYPRSEYVDEAEGLVRDCYDRLARHEMYVARFYLRRNKNKAAIGRTRVVEERYAKSNLVAEAIFVRGETYMNMDDNAAARETFIGLAEEYPDSPEAERARDYLRHLGVNLDESAPTSDDEDEQDAAEDVEDASEDEK